MKENKIPTAKEFCNSDELLKTIIFTNCLDNGEVKELCVSLKRFAILHVKAALDAALKESLWVSGIEGVDYDDIADSILPAYPEELIK